MQDIQKEAYQLRSEMNRLKQRLMQIDKELLSDEEKATYCSSNVCGQDVIIEHLQKLVAERLTNNIAILACWEKKEDARFYSTTITPDYIPHLIRNSENILKWIQEFNDKFKIQILELLAIKFDHLSVETIISENKEFSEEHIRSIIDELIRDDYLEYVKGNIRISMKGWQTYIVLGHLAYNFTYKLSIDKAINIAQAFKEVFNVNWGEPINLDDDEVISILNQKGYLKDLAEKKVFEDDIRTILYELKLLKDK